MQHLPGRDGLNRLLPAGDRQVRRFVAAGFAVDVAVNGLPQPRTVGSRWLAGKPGG